MSQPQSCRERAAADLLVAARLAQQLRMHTGQVEQLIEQLAAGDALDHTANEASMVRNSLEAAAAQRQTLLQRWRELPSMLDQLDQRGAETLRADVSAVGDVAELPWVALRALVTPLLVRADRLAANQASAAHGGRPKADPPSIANWSVVVDVDPAWYLLHRTLANQRCPAPASHVVPLLAPVALVGRSSSVAGPQPHILLDSDTSVSRRHAQFVVGDTSLSLVDLSSTNGTYVVAAGVALGPTVTPLVAGVPRELHHGDRVFVGAWTRLTVVAANR